MNSCVRTRFSVNQLVIAESSQSDCSGLTGNSNFEEAVKILDISLKEHALPILIGVSHPYNVENIWKNKCSSNKVKYTNHFIVVVGSGYDQERNQKYYLFYEVGTSKEIAGRSQENRLYVDTQRSLIVGKTDYVDKDNYYTVTEIRRNNGKTYNTQ